MLVHIYSAKCMGIDAALVTAEVNISLGIGIHLCGLCDIAVKESLLRTTTALQSLDYHIPGKKIVINLAPADMHKSGSGYDLAIAVGIIAASSQIQLPLIPDTIIMGELGLDGSIRPIRGGLIIADFALKNGFKHCILPYESALEATCLNNISIYGVKNFNDVITILSNSLESESFLVNSAKTKSILSTDNETQGVVDFYDIIGQEGAKRAMEIAASGAHNIIMLGPAGSGKSSLAKGLAGILPPMSEQESFECSKIYSIAGLGNFRNALMHTRPFRSPHYNASLASMLGGNNGGDNIMPGEISLAHRGVLFLDEFNLMPKALIESLRGPIEDRKISISRLRCKVEYPASFTLVTAANPCVCGFYTEGEKCTCTPSQRRQYLKKLSGPILDRMDLQIIVHPLTPKDMISKIRGEHSAQIAKRVARTREIQHQRFKNLGIQTNSEMSNKHIEKLCPLSKESEEAMRDLMEKLDLSMRAYYRIIKLARTIADMEESQEIKLPHLLEAAAYRFLDKTNIL